MKLLFNIAEITTVFVLGPLRVIRYICFILRLASTLIKQCSYLALYRHSTQQQHHLYKARFGSHTRTYLGM